MGTTWTPRYRIECWDQGGKHLMAWDGRGLGVPTHAKAEAWRQDMNASYQLGGINGHIAPAIGYVPHINRVQIVHQRTGGVVCAACMPMFEVV